MIEPAFGRGAGAQAKTVGKARKDFDLGRGALRADGFNALAHHAFVCDVVPVTHTGISGRLIAVDFPSPVYCMMTAPGCGYACSPKDAVP